MSKRIIGTIGAAVLVALSTAAFAGTALADSAGAVGCSASNEQNGDFITVNAIAADAINGNNVLANCPASASAS